MKFSFIFSQFKRKKNPFFLADFWRYFSNQLAVLITFERISRFQSVINSCLRSFITKVSFSVSFRSI